MRQFTGLQFIPQTNTFQAVVITSGNESYALFTYECGSMQWSSKAVIGISVNYTYTHVHRLSNTYRTNEVACINVPATVWSNVLYQISDGAVPVPSGWQPTQTHILYLLFVHHSQSLGRPLVWHVQVNKVYSLLHVSLSE